MHHILQLPEHPVDMQHVVEGTYAVVVGNRLAMDKEMFGEASKVYRISVNHDYYNDNKQSEK